MVEQEFVGDVNDLSDEQKSLIAKVVEERGFKNAKINVQPVGKAGDNYIADVKRITVEKNGTTLRIIAKVAPKDETARQFGNTHILFTNEHVMYTKVLPKFTQLEKSANVPENERLRYAVCYGTHMEEPNELILLEDLDVHGFKMLDRFTPLTDENVRLILRSFAIFHSLSYVLKYQEPETYDMFCKSLCNFRKLLSNVPETIKWFIHLDADVQSILVDDKYKKIYKNMSSQMMTNSAKFEKIDANSKTSVIQQGDPWTNNIMFKIEDNKTVDCCMIDYQLAKQGSPVADLHYMIFNCTDHPTRMKHYHEWIDYYHSQLDQNLANFGLKANYVYPRDQLDADLRGFVKMSLGLVVMLASFLVRESADAEKFKESINAVNGNQTVEETFEKTSLRNSDSETIKKFRARLEGVADSFIELGYL